ncbi:MAG: substrate-binding domain-containing protein [Bacteroidetes bacterium]|nr:substrate-binding domain-containing protein [Bacteroidota bacterium]
MASFLNACTESGPADNATSGSIKISVDETYKPVMEEQLKVFLARFPNAKIIAEYKPEADCIKDFFEDSTRVIFVTRELSKEETDYALSKQIVAKSMAMARDAVVFITSKNAKKQDFTIKELRNIMTGQDSASDYQIVFDNKNSSTVRYIQDSLISGKKIAANVFAATNCEDVINYVSKNDKAIGVIGVSWVADPTDSVAESFLQQVNIAGIWPDNDSVNQFVKPYQAYIGLREYPCTRNFYFISKETWQGLGSGFVNYLCRDGQLVFRTSKMFPLRVNVVLREASSTK